MKTKKKKPMGAISTRVDEEKIKEAKLIGIDISQIFRLALDRELFKHVKACPTCKVVKR